MILTGRLGYASCAGALDAASTSSARQPMAIDLIRRCCPTSDAQYSARARPSSLRADIAGTARILEAADRLGDHLLRQPQNDFREIDRERDRAEEDDVDRQRSAQCLREANADEFGCHQQHQS